MKSAVRQINTLTEWIERFSRWLVAILVLVVTFGVILRYVFNAPNLWTYEVTIMTGACMYALGLAYAHRVDRHIRVDIFYGHLSYKWKGLVDLAGHMIFFFPLVLLVSYASISWAVNSWVTAERMSETGWYPPYGPTRTLIALGWTAFAVQGIAQCVRAIHQFKKGEPYD